MQTNFGADFLTNEEKQVPAYSNSEQYTVASTVTPDTPLNHTAHVTRQHFAECISELQRCCTSQLRSDQI
jgi:hypothetical protein